MTQTQKDIFDNKNISIATSTEEYKINTIDETEDRVKDLLNLKPVRKPKRNNDNK